MPMDIATLPLVLRTVQHLRPSQCAARLLRHVKRRLPLRAGHVRSKFNELAAASFVNPPQVPPRRTAGGGGEQFLAQLRDNQLELLNQQQAFDVSSPNWRLGPCRRDRLWTVTLHYHEWLYRVAVIAADGADEADDLLRTCLSNWITECDIARDGAEQLAWNPYAISTRLEWWARTIVVLGKGYWREHTELWRRLTDSMWRQAQYLHCNLEWDLRANHLLRDAVGLAWAGRFFSGSLPKKWLRSATRLAISQADEQLLADGGHFERSPMYHLDVMDDFEVLAHLLSDGNAQQVMRAACNRLSEVARWLRHPDGQVVQLNDAERRCADSLGPQPTGGRHFAETGLIVWQGDPWCLFFDVGEIGPDYQPGHAHADTLTVECSYNGQRLFVDPGCHSYDNDDRRRYDRATDSHNTVCIDGVDSSEVWHIFRVGRRARPLPTVAEFTPQTMHAVGGHDGYQFLQGQPTHRRTVDIDTEGALRIADVIEGGRRHTVSGGYLLEPCWQVESFQDGWRLHSGSTNLTIRIAGSTPLELTTESRPVHPHFGVVTESQRLCWRYEGELPLRVETEVSASMTGARGPLGTRRNESAAKLLKQNCER